MFALYCSMFFSARTELSEDEARAYDRVLSMQAKLWAGLRARNIDLSIETDPRKTGLIGVEWSPITTTLGPLEAKRTATDPRWAAWLLRYFDSLGIESGDKLVINASGSFPGLLLSALVASEIRGVALSLFVSLTSSTWGANRTDAPLPVILKILNDNGIKISPKITLGGNDERGGGLGEDSIKILRASAEQNGFTLSDSVSTDELERFNPKAVILIGGSVSSSKIEKRYPSSLRLLNLKQLSQTAGIPYGGLRFERKFIQTDSGKPDKKNAALAAIGLILFFCILKTHKRWDWEDIQK